VFKFYEADYTPPNNQIKRLDGVVETAFASANAVPVVIRSYSPIAMPTGMTDPNLCVTIQKRDASNTCVWTDAHSIFTVRMHPLTPGTNEVRAIDLSRGALAPIPGIYRVIPVGLVSDSVTNRPPVQ